MNTQQKNKELAKLLPFVFIIASILSGVAKAHRSGFIDTLTTQPVQEQTSIWEAHNDL